MRIIAGTARSRPIVSPRGMDTRPTLDRIRESLFNILQSNCSEARVLDLFAGSGALGLEALSRGALEATFVDMDKRAIAAVKKNVEALGFFTKAQIIQDSWDRAITKLRLERRQFDLIFLDPPYRMTNTDEMLHEIVKNELLHREGIAMVEHATATPPRETEALPCVDARKYGDTSIRFYAFREG